MADGILSAVGPSMTKLIWQLLAGLVVIVILTILYFGTRTVMKWWNQRKQYNIRAVVFNPDGTFFVRWIGKFKGSDGVDKMRFMGSAETCPVIDPKHIIGRCVGMWRYAPGQYAIIPPTVWQKMTPAQFKIDVIDIQMKNFAFLEQRAAVSRWAAWKDALQKYAPFITIVILAIVAGVVLWFLMNTGLEMYNSVVNARMEECARVMGQTLRTPSA
jgi:hypothetical protein